MPPLTAVSVTYSFTHDHVTPCDVVISVKPTHPQFPHYNPFYWILLHNSWRHTNLYKNVPTGKGSYSLRNVTHVVTNTCFCANRLTGDLINRAELSMTYSKETAMTAGTFISAVSLHF